MTNVSQQDLDKIEIEKLKRKLKGKSRDYLVERLYHVSNMINTKLLDANMMTNHNKDIVKWLVVEIAKRDILIQNHIDIDVRSPFISIYDPDDYAPDETVLNKKDNKETQDDDTDETQTEDKESDNK